MAEDGGGETEVTTSETTFTQNTEVVQLIMQDDAGQAILPEGQLIQVTTGEGQMHYIQVGFHFSSQTSLGMVSDFSSLMSWGGLNFPSSDLFWVVSTFSHLTYWGYSQIFLNLSVQIYLTRCFEGCS